MILLCLWAALFFLYCLFAPGASKIIKAPNLDPLHIIDQALEQDVPQLERQRIRAIMIEELQRLHEGVLARYGLRPSDYQHWKKITERK